MSTSNALFAGETEQLEKKFLTVNDVGQIYGEIVQVTESGEDKPPITYLDVWEIFFCSGVKHFNEAELMQSLSDFTAVVNLKSDVVEAWNNLGVCLMRTGKPGKALKCFNEALRLRPGNVLAANNRDIVLRMLKDPVA